MEPYSPRRILTDEQEAEIGGDFLSYLISKADNQDPITPFSSIKTIDDRLRIHINNTNDLKWTIDDAIGWINSDQCDYVIIGEDGEAYSTELCKALESLFATYSPVEIIKEEEWIIVKINIKNKKVIISNQTIKIE
jgi:flagellar hook assembly protein FlgD|tara:strand:+ start:1151 stop:1558 length:408 start_codon:yes stop_codon:yes gene_type:complete